MSNGETVGEVAQAYSVASQIRQVAYGTASRTVALVLHLPTLALISDNRKAACGHGREGLGFIARPRFPRLKSHKLEIQTVGASDI